MDRTDTPQQLPTRPPLYVLFSCGFCIIASLLYYAFCPALSTHVTCARVWVSLSLSLSLALSCSLLLSLALSCSLSLSFSLSLARSLSFFLCKYNCKEEYNCQEGSWGDKSRALSEKTKEVWCEGASWEKKNAPLHHTFFLQKRSDVRASFVWEDQKKKRLMWGRDLKFEPTIVRESQKGKVLRTPVKTTILKRSTKTLYKII